MPDPNLAQLMQLPGAANSAMPPASPIQPQAQVDPLTDQLLKASQLGQQSYQEQIGRAHQLASQIAQLQQQQSAEPLPKTRWQPQYERISGPGSLLRDVGKGLLQAVSLTGPGQQIQNALYEPGVAQYQMTQGRRAQQIAEMQEQMGQEEKPLEAASQLQYKPYMAQAQTTRANAVMLNAQNKALHDRAMEKLEASGQQIKQQLGQGKLTVEQARTKAMELIAANHDATIQNVAGTYSDQRDRDAQIQAFETEYKTQTDSWLQNLLGTAPTAPSRQATPAPGPKAVGSGTARNAPGKTKGVLKYNPATGRLE